MPSIVVIKEKLENPKEWFKKEFKEDGEWETDSILGKVCLGNIYLEEGEDYTSFEDTEELAFLVQRKLNSCYIRVGNFSESA